MKYNSREIQQKYKGNSREIEIQFKGIQVWGGRFRVSLGTVTGHSQVSEGFHSQVSWGCRPLFLSSCVEDNMFLSDACL